MSKELDLIRYAQNMGVVHLWPHWSVCPEVLGRQVLDVAKRASRLLGKECRSLSHSACLEAIARGAGMPNWHALQTLAQALIDDFNTEIHWPRPKGGSERAEALMPAFPMLASASQSCAPTKEAANGMRLFAARTATAASVPVETVLDVVAKLNGADSWDYLLARRPEDSKEPLYEFFVEEGEHSRGGRFVWSDACQELVEQQDTLFQQYYERDEVEQATCRETVMRVTSQRPDFLEGLLAKTYIIYPGYENRRQCGRVYAEAIERADALMPAKFKGQVSWLFTENRFYHRLLYGYMIWNIMYGSRNRAVTLARKQLRMNPQDNLGVRYFLPLLLAADDQLSSAKRALTRIESDSRLDAGAPFVRSLVLATQGLWRESIQSLLHALFVYPSLRDVVALDYLKPWEPIAESNRRQITLDRQTLLEQYVILTPHCVDLEDRFAFVVNHPEVKQAERKLERIFATWRKSRSVEDFDKWMASVEFEAHRFAAVLEEGM